MTGSRNGTDRNSEPSSNHDFGAGWPHKRLALRIGQRPAQRLEVGIDGEIVAGEQFDPVTVGIADIEEERVGDAVAAGPALHVGEIAARSP